MPWMAAAAVIGAGASIYASSKASKAQKKASNQATNTEQKMFDATRADNSRYYGLGTRDVNAGFKQAAGALTPYANYGTQATDRMSALSGLYGSGAQVNALQGDPGYQFRMDQGVSALDRSAASRGMLQSGAQQKALVGYGQGLASDELNNAYGRVAGVQQNAQQAAGALSNLYQNRGTTLGNLATGQASQNQNLSMNTSNALGGYAMAGGQARAQGYENTGSAINAGLQNGLTAYMMQQQQGGMYGGRNRGY